MVLCLYDAANWPILPNLQGGTKKLELASQKCARYLT